MTSKSLNIETPSFSRLFIISRIICNYIDTTSNDDGNTIQQLIDSLTNTFTDKSVSSQAHNILLRLISFGLNNYMSQWYNETKDTNIIELMFNQIILTKFEQKYSTIIKYTSDDKYKNLAFNSSDIMTNIFQFLQYDKEFEGDLFECSLVNSYWLYHVLNTNSIYHINLTELLWYTWKYTRNINPLQLEQQQQTLTSFSSTTINRAWQRINKAKSVYFVLSHEANEVILDKLSLLKNIEKIEIKSGDQRYATRILKALMKRCDAKIKWYRSSIDYKGILDDLEMKLLNAEYIELDKCYYNIVWSDKCEQLMLRNIRNINEKWCNFIVDKCDCSGIKCLYFWNIGFGDVVDNKLLLKLQSKFINLKRLILYFNGKCDLSVLSFWILLKPFIVQQKIRVELEIGSIVTKEEFEKLDLIIDQEKLKINSFSIATLSTRFTNFLKKLDNIKNIVDNSGLNKLKINSLASQSEGLSLIWNYLCDNYSSATNGNLKDETSIAAEVERKDDNISSITDRNGGAAIAINNMDIDHDRYKLLNTIEINGKVAINVLNDLLNSKMILDKQLLILIDVKGYWPDWFQHKLSQKCDDVFLALFDKLCKIVCDLMICSWIPIDIKINFGEVIFGDIGFSSNFRLRLKQTFWSYFEEKTLVKKYKQPCNVNVCQWTPLVKARTSIGVGVDSAYDDFIFRVANVEQN